MTKVFFTPGPTEIHPVAKQAIQEALNSGVCSISHRSKEYEKIQENTENQLRKLLSVPNDYKVFFLSSGTEAWERVIQNGVKEKSFHLINGSFSKRFYETSQELGKTPSFIEKPLGSGFDLSDIPDNLDTEVICLTHNETSTGVSLQEGLIENLHSKFPDKLIAVDVVSSAPYPKIDLKTVDYYFFSVQKYFCLPAGLGILIVSPRAMEKAKQLKAIGLSIGSHHSLLSLGNYAEKFQTPCTPNVLGVYTLGQVTESFNKTGINVIREQCEQKAKLIYDLLERQKAISAFVPELRWRSKTVITAECSTRTTQIVKTLADKGFIVGQGYGKLKDTQIRIANFSAHSIKCVQSLADELSLLAQD